MSQEKSAGELKQLHLKTPLLHSLPLSALVSTPIYLKLENVQPCNSFKIRGMSRLCQTRIKQGFKGFVTASGGNAGIALAFTCKLLQKPCHVFVPSFVAPRTLEKMRILGAEVKMTETAREAMDAAAEMGQKNPDLSFVHPYDDPEIWTGYSEMVKEVRDQLPCGTIPSCFIVSVGGGGLLTGTLKGLEAVGWENVPVIAMETIGAHSLNKSIAAGKIVQNVPMTSIAKTLGAPSVAPELFNLILENKFKVISHTLTDQQAVHACFKFADDHTFLVEPSCGVSLATVYDKILPNLLTENGVDIQSGPVVIIVCGGCDTSPEILMGFAKHLGMDV